MFLKWKNFQQNYFIMVDNTEIQEATINKFDEWLEALGNLVRNIGQKELNGIVQLTEGYNKALNKEINDKDSLQDFLGSITEIKNSSMEMEFRINEVQEQFRILQMYSFTIEEEQQKEVDNLMLNWEELIEYADK
jgi:hypothetical protein